MQVFPHRLGEHFLDAAAARGVQEMAPLTGATGRRSYCNIRNHRRGSRRLSRRQREKFFFLDAAAAVEDAVWSRTGGVLMEALSRLPRRTHYSSSSSSSYRPRSLVSQEPVVGGAGGARRRTSGGRVPGFMPVEGEEDAARVLAPRAPFGSHPLPLHDSRTSASRRTPASSGPPVAAAAARPAAAAAPTAP